MSRDVAKQGRCFDVSAKGSRSSRRLGFAEEYSQDKWFGQIDGPAYTVVLYTFGSFFIEKVEPQRILTVLDLDQQPFA